MNGNSSIPNFETSVISLVDDLRRIINQARVSVATKANSAIILMYWQLGERINREVLGNKRAAYGQQIVSQVATQLQKEFGKKGFGVRSIRRMMQFADYFPDIHIVSQVATQLTWSHIIEILPLKNDIQREFYLTLASAECWGRDLLREKIDSMLFERTAISRKPDELIRHELANLRNESVLTPDLVFKSPYFLEFTGLKGMYSERSLEDTLVANLEQFILELGGGFSFVERQKRMIIDGEDFYLDLLFYHRRLHRLIAIELEKGRFKAAYKGQMELYLRWLEQNEVEPGEESPLGLLLCTEGGEEQIELLQLDKSGIRVAQYLTELPSKEQLRASIGAARRRWENRQLTATQADK